MRDKETIYDLVMSGRCTPICLCAGNDNGQVCTCRCNGKYHAAASGLHVDGVWSADYSAAWYNDSDIDYVLRGDLHHKDFFYWGHSKKPGKFHLTVDPRCPAAAANRTFYRMGVGHDDIVMCAIPSTVEPHFTCHDGLMEILWDLRELGVIEYCRMSDQPRRNKEFACVVDGIESYEALLALIGLIYDYITLETDVDLQIQHVLFWLDRVLLEKRRF